MSVYLYRLWRKQFCPSSFFAAAVLSILRGKKGWTEKVCSRGWQALADMPHLKIRTTISVCLTCPVGGVAERRTAFWASRGQGWGQYHRRARWWRWGRWPQQMLTGQQTGKVVDSGALANSCLEGGNEAVAASVKQFSYWMRFSKLYSTALENPGAKSWLREFAEANFLKSR